jgi:hypothetical protein
MIMPIAAPDATLAMVKDPAHVRLLGELVMAYPERVERAARPDGRGQQNEVAHGPVAEGAVHGTYRRADPPAQQRDLVLAARAASRGCPSQLVADVPVQAAIGVLVVGHAPVARVDVEALVEQLLDERIARAQVEDVGAVDQREREQDRDRVLAAIAAVPVQRGCAIRRHDVPRRDRREREIERLGADAVSAVRASSTPKRSVASSSSMADAVLASARSSRRAIKARRCVARQAARAGSSGSPGRRAS